MSAYQRCKLFLSRLTAILDSFRTTPGRREADESVEVPPVSPGPLPVQDSTSLEILHLVHDLKNQLMIMILAANEAADDATDARSGRLQELQQSVERAVLLANALLLDEHSVPPGRRPVDVNEVVRRTAATLPSISEAIRVQVGLWPEPLPVIAQAGDLERVLLNLALNASDAMPEGGVLTIKTAIAHRPGLSPGKPLAPYVRLTVRDTGRGMPPEVKDRIFHPFFTTKEGGTGLGLHSVAFAVEQLQGRISVESEPGHGTSVTLLLPLAHETYRVNRAGSGLAPESLD